MLRPSLHASHAHLCRHKLASAFKATCISFGPDFSRDVVEPALLAASGAPDWRPATARASLHAAAVAARLAPASTEAERAGRWVVGCAGARPGFGGRAGQGSPLFLPRALWPGLNQLGGWAKTRPS